MRVFPHSLNRFIDLKGVKIGWELRHRRENIPTIMVNLLQDFDCIHCKDLSIDEIPNSKDTVYLKFFGKGMHNIYHFDHEELSTIDTKAMLGTYKRVRLAFHGARIYKDAARLKIFKKTKHFPPITHFCGLDSLKEVLREDTPFPSSKEHLINDQGWKVFDLTSTLRIHLSDIFIQLPDIAYSNLSELVKILRDNKMLED